MIEQTFNPTPQETEIKKQFQISGQAGLQEWNLVSNKHLLLLSLSCTRAWVHTCSCFFLLFYVYAYACRCVCVFSFLKSNPPCAVRRGSLTELWGVSWLPSDFRNQPVFASPVLGSSVLSTIPALMWVAGVKGAYASGPHALCSEHFAD